MKYYLCAHQEGDWYLQNTFDSYNDLIKYLHSCQASSWYSKGLSIGYWSEKKYCYDNSVLDRLNMSGKDVYVEVKTFYFRNEFGEIVGEKKVRNKHIRPYMVLDGNDRIVDVRKFFTEILEYRRETKRIKWKPNGAKRRSRNRINSDRNIQMGQLVRMVEHPDFKKYNRVRPFA